VRSLRDEFDFPIFFNADHTPLVEQGHRCGRGWV
jgi:hypothetical protein